MHTLQLIKGTKNKIYAVFLYMESLDNDKFEPEKILENYLKTWAKK